MLVAFLSPPDEALGSVTEQSVPWSNPRYHGTIPNIDFSLFTHEGSEFSALAGVGVTTIAPIAITATAHTLATIFFIIFRELLQELASSGQRI